MIETMRENRLRVKLVQGDIAFGAALQIPSPLLVEMLSSFDFVMLDGEHGYAFDNLLPLILAAEATGIAPIVRIPSHERSHIVRALEAGASGIHVPMVNTREQALALVHEVKYAPLGGRGYSTATRAAGFGMQPRSDHTERANREVLLIVTLETREAMQNAREIASVPGVDLIFVGRDDLSESLGAFGSRDDERVTGAMSRAFKEIAALKPLGTTAFKPEDVSFWSAQGVRFFLTWTTYPIRKAFEETHQNLVEGLQ